MSEIKLDAKVSLNDLSNWDANQLLEYIKKNNLDTFEHFVWQKYIYPEEDYTKFVELLDNIDTLGEKIALGYLVSSYELYKDFTKEDEDDYEFGYTRKQEYKKMLESKRKIFNLEPGVNKDFLEMIEIIDKALA